MHNFQQYKKLIESEIENLDWERTEAGLKNPLEEAMFYSLDAGGKRVRPILCLLAANLRNKERQDEDLQIIIRQFAVAIEMIHTFSLMQDDLPALDNDELRRGKKTNHVVYGEAGAILASDGLMILAMQIMTEVGLGTKNEEQQKRCLEATKIILEATGGQGMLWGQWLDLSAEEKIDGDFDLEQMNDEKKISLLREIHRHKTGDLIQASLWVGAILGGIEGEKLEAVKKYGVNLGLCFQITDDILDETSSAEKLGKTAGKDKDQGKLTYPSLFGLKKSRKLAEEASEKARRALDIFNSEESRELLDLVNLLEARVN